ncbi:hypothetical protein [Sinorhizobium meliloti]|uniref:hypothetical protein n=1 Tax=Rhizobium meliloti TaxID=382 RepID=UPI000FD96D96|nr:hypothetical protein [Sinorhizobium meliloti]RVG88664.1 hypothetical protein CN219_03590 [Sinorhizobium meliloti]RVI39054.1 hypothetical protein CN197_02645 [Sinorhizobium meliloti]RVI46689.1 hypothetical protein CN196_09495 [Sinorhizobium meliloti]RVJ25691.1 hypothetical protein CN177_13535 [Sinorhizobium meliloti]RVK02230.1 hypothetical protein CN170_08595 [Sinorhizobium meliloti]
MAVEFNDASHYGFFMTGTTLTSSTGKYTRVSELTLAALRAQGVFDNMEDGTSPPAIDKLWLDKNTDPAVLKEYDATGSAWVPMTFERLFGRAIVTPLAAPTGSANALVVAEPEPFIPHRMYSLTPVADNTGAATIQVTGVGTFAVTYTDGTALEAQEFKTGNPTILLFTGVRFEVIFKVADVYQAADAAAEAAEAALAAANAGFVFDTEADFEAANIPAPLQFVETAGYYAPGDGGAHRKVRSTAVDVFAKQSADGSWWAPDYKQRLSVEAFGASSKTLAELVAMAGVGAAAWAAANTTAVQKAVDFRNAFGGGFVDANGQFYALSGMGVQIKDGVHILCSGNDEWEPVYNNPKVWKGTNWLLYGTGTKHLQFPGITSGEHGGGWREDPDALGTYYKKWTAYNSDASGTTPATLKSFSAGFWSKDSCNNGLYDCRVIPWNGANGVEGYDSGNSLGDDWSFAVACINGDELRRINIQAVGYYREMGFIAATTISTNSRMEKCRFIDLTCQGRSASGFYAPDRWATVGANGPDWFEIKASSEQYFDPAGGTPFRMSDNLNRAYSSITVSGANLRFNGVSPAPGSAFHVRHAGRGWAGTTVSGLRNYPLFHHSGNAVETYGLQKASAHQVSGFPMRGLIFPDKTKVHCSNRTGEQALIQYWDAQDVHFTGVPQVEGGKWCFASDVSSAVAYCSAPVGETRNIRFVDSEGFDDLRALGYLDQTWFPRNAFDPALQMSPRSTLTGDLDIKSYRVGKKTRLFDDQHSLFLDSRVITTVTSGFGFVTVTSQTCTFRHIQMGKIVFFKMVHTWSGLDIADTSAISIRLPVDAATGALFNAVVNDRLSTGISLAGVDNPYVDLATDNYLGISRSDATRLAYTNMLAAGELHISGSYWVD